MTLFVAGLIALFVFAAAAGLSGSFVIAAIAALIVAPAAGMLAGKRFLPSSYPASFPRALRIAGAVAAAVALLALARLTIFIADPSRTSYSVVPASDWELRHSCVTAYYVAADIVGRIPNVYDVGIYEAPGGDPARPRVPRTMGLFRIDQYEYPPPFLLLPRTLQAMAPGFLRFRMLWYGLNGLVVLIGFVVVARHLRGDATGRALLLVPFVFASIITLNTLQKGNVQLAVIAAAMIAMVLVEQRHRAAGGAVLAYLTLAKLYPGLLVLYLLVRRDWRAVAWTGAVALALLGLTLADVGRQPFMAFVQHFPGLMSGEAFPAFRNPNAVAINQSIPGLVFKLKLFGVSGLGFGAAQIVGTIYMLVAVALTVVLARRDIGDEQRPLVWLAVLIFATLRSPFLPQSYAPFPAIWLGTLLFATASPALQKASYFLAGYLVLNIFIPTDAGLPPQLVAIVTILPQALTIGLAVLMVRLAVAGRYRATASLFAPAAYSRAAD